MYWGLLAIAFLAIKLDLIDSKLTIEVDQIWESATLMISQTSILDHFYYASTIHSLVTLQLYGN